MKKFLAICSISLLLILSFQNASFSQQKYWQQQVNFNIDVSLDDKDHSLDGFVKMEYTNNSPDTLNYIWIHLWPNAYKNDKTAFSDQFLENGRPDFYFSEKEKRGYINRLNFKVNGITSRLEDHPQHIDIAKLILPVFLLPGMTIQISTPFHVQLPFNFSRGGHVENTYQVTQWYPKPAVYDQTGWHPMPYLDQGEFYSEFGNYQVQITLPKSYIAAATGLLQNEDEKNYLKSKIMVRGQTTVSADNPALTKNKKPKKIGAYAIKIKEAPVVAASPIIEGNKTLSYKAENVHDFAWFADRTFQVQFDTLQLASGKIIEAWAFNRPQGSATWKNSIRYLKQSVRTRSAWLGEYPYPVVTAIHAPIGFNGGMEYPMITSISDLSDERELEMTIEHEVGHNWNYGILGSNERSNSWMDEGINVYYDKRYSLEFPAVGQSGNKKKPGLVAGSDEIEFIYQHIIKTKIDQPIATPSESFSALNYSLISYEKTSRWMQLLERELGKQVLDSGMKYFYQQNKFSHPHPADLKKSLETVSGKSLDEQFALLNKTGPLPGELIQHRPFKIKPFFTLKETTKFNHIFIAPAIGYNFYDKALLGVALHNYTIPANNFQFFLAPVIGTATKDFGGLGRLEYSWYPGKTFSKIEVSLSGARHNVDDFVDSTGTRNFLGMQKLVPSIRFDFKSKNPRSKVSKFIQWKTFFIEEEELMFTRDTVQLLDIITYPKASRYLNQLKFVVENNRVLYPYRGEIQFEQGEDFIRAAFEGKYFFNFSKGGGINLRLFAGKFMYMGDKTFLTQFRTDRYHLNMTGPKGYEDYTYSNYFIGRNEFDKFSSQQIMIRDGGFKVRTDLLAAKVGRTDDWLAALNLKTDIPSAINPLSVLPVKIPIKVFLDLGTYAEAWKENSSSGRFLYDAGLQVSLLKNIVNVYIPLLYSKIYRDYFKSTITEKRFVKNIAFSIDIQNFRLKNLFGL